MREEEGAAHPEPPPRRGRPPVRHEEEVWVFTGEVEEERSPRGRSTARRVSTVDGDPAPAPARRPDKRLPELPGEVAAELTNAVGQQRGAKLAERLAAATRAYERDRYLDAGRITKVLAMQVPESQAARELHGLVAYRMGRWREAVRHLEAARELGGGDPSQLPVIMDCHRAMGHHRRVAGLWDELRAASPEADVLAEGRLVLAADVADRGDLGQAIELLQNAGAGKSLRHPAERHVRQWYLLADLLERAGDLPRARELFGRVVEADPDLADAGSRLAALGRRRPRPGR